MFSRQGEDRPPAAEDKPATTAARPSGRVLIVEDDFMTLLALSTLFERNGWAVSVAMAMISLPRARAG